MLDATYHRVSDGMPAFFDWPSELTGRALGFVQRRSKRTTDLLVKRLVVGLLEKGDATLTDLVEVARKLGVSISESGFAQRLSKGAEQVLKH